MSDVNLEIQPPGDQLIEGGDMVLICSVAKGTGTIAFSWHREGTERSLGRKMVRALSAELRIAAVREQDAGRYYCSADNIQGPILSKRIRVTPKSKFLAFSLNLVPKPRFSFFVSQKDLLKKARKRGVKI